MAVAVCTWNLFHGRAQPPLRANLLPAFATTLATRDWDLCALQEVPPWWPAELGRRLGASARVARTSLVRAAAPKLQEAVHRREPEFFDKQGAAVNALLVRPGAGVIEDHRIVRVRQAPQRRTAHGVALRRPDGTRWWAVNVHTHNKPESRAAADLVTTLRAARAWAGEPTPVLVLGDLNLPVPQGLARVEGFDHLAGHRVDHLLARRLRGGGGWYSEVVQPRAGLTLSDHRLVGGLVEFVNEASTSD